MKIILNPEIPTILRSRYLSGLIQTTFASTIDDWKPCSIPRVLKNEQLTVKYSYRFLPWKYGRTTCMLFVCPDWTAKLRSDVPNKSLLKISLAQLLLANSQSFDES